MKLSRSPFDRSRSAVAPAKLPITPIARVRNHVKAPRPYGWETVESEICLLPGLDPQMLQGLSGFSHLIVVFWLDRLGEERPRPVLLEPAEGLPTIGILATRSQLRPNPIGVSIVPLLAVSGARLTVRGLDAIDGTPVLDLKPYIPHYDNFAAATVPDWVSGDAR